MSRVTRKAAFSICENKDADQLCGNREADQRLCFRYTDSTIPLLSKFEISMLLNHLLWLCSPVCVRPGQKPRRPVFSERGSYWNDTVAKPIMWLNVACAALMSQISLGNSQI